MLFIHQQFTSAPTHLQMDYVRVSDLLTITDPDNYSPHYCVQVPSSIYSKTIFKIAHL